MGASATWEYSLNSGSHWTTGSGSKFTVTGDGNKTVLARQIDSAGNISPQTTSFNFVLDTNAPITLTANGTALNDSLVNFSEANSGVSFRVNLIGDVVLSDKVSLLVNGSELSYQSIDGSSLSYKVISNQNLSDGFVDFSVSKTQLGSEGIKSITAKLVDATNNITLTSPIAFTLDTIAPAAPSIAEHSSSTDLNDGKMNDVESVSTTFQVSLLNTGAVVGDKVELLLGGSSFSSAKVLTLGILNITNGYVDFTVVKNDLGIDGSKSLTAKVTDIAGNAGVANGALTFILDTVAPVPSSITVDTVLADSFLNSAEVVSVIPFKVNWLTNLSTSECKPGMRCGKNHKFK